MSQQQLQGNCPLLCDCEGWKSFFDVLDTFLLLVLLQTVKWFDRFLSNLRLTFVGCVWDLGSHTDQVGKCVAFSSDMKDFSYVCVII